MVPGSLHSQVPVFWPSSATAQDSPICCRTSLMSPKLCLWWDLFWKGHSRPTGCSHSYELNPSCQRQPQMGEQHSSLVILLLKHLEMQVIKIWDTQNKKITLLDLIWRVKSRGSSINWCKLGWLCQLIYTGGGWMQNCLMLLLWDLVDMWNPAPVSTEKLPAYSSKSVEGTTQRAFVSGLEWFEACLACSYSSLNTVVPAEWW